MTLRPDAFVTTPGTHAAQQRVRDGAALRTYRD